MIVIRSEFYEYFLQCALEEILNALEKILLKKFLMPPAVGHFKEKILKALVVGI